MLNNSPDDDSLARMLGHVADQPSPAPYVEYANRVMEVTADGLLGTLTPNQVALECDFAYAQLQDAGAQRAPVFREAWMPLVQHAIQGDITADSLVSLRDSLVMRVTQ